VEMNELPTELVRIVLQFLSLKDIGKLDSITLSSKHRPAFLSALTGLEITRLGSVRITNAILVKWLILRHIAIKDLKIGFKGAIVKELIHQNQQTLRTIILTANEVKYGFVFCFKVCSGLKEIDLRYCSSLTGEEIENILPSFPHLQKLNLTGCIRLSPATLISISKCHNLLELNLSSLNFVLGRDIELIISGCPNLQRLDLSCTNTTDNSIFRITEELKQLEFLRLRRCSRITSSGACCVINQLVIPRLYSDTPESHEFGIIMLSELLELGQFHPIRFCLKCFCRISDERSEGHNPSDGISFPSH
jgi:hypothetical protein